MRHLLPGGVIGLKLRGARPLHALLRIADAVRDAELFLVGRLRLSRGADRVLLTPLVVGVPRRFEFLIRRVVLSRCRRHFRVLHQLGEGRRFVLQRHHRIVAGLAGVLGDDVLLDRPGRFGGIGAANLKQMVDQVGVAAVLRDQILERGGTLGRALGAGCAGRR
jgi:hypothetical protein